MANTTQAPMPRERRSLPARSAPASMWRTAYAYASAVQLGVGQLAGRLEGPGAPHGSECEGHALLDRAGEGEQPVVGVELAAVGDGPLVQQRPHHVQCFLDAGQGAGAGPVDAVPRQEAKLPLDSTASARPPESSSSVARTCAISVGSRRVTGETLGPRRMFRV